MAAPCVPENPITAEDFENIAGYLKIAGVAVSKIPGTPPIVGPLLGFLTGQNRWAASVGDLADKIKKGTVKPEDYADVASATASTLVSFGLLIGNVNPWIKGISLAVAVGLAAWKNRELIAEVYGDTSEAVSEYILDRLIPDAEAGMADFPYPPSGADGSGEEGSNYNPPQDNDNTDTGWGAGDKNGGCGAAGGPGQGGKDSGNAATVPRRGDPLTFDLDGDGIETTGRGNRIVFDHNADGVKNGTGWVNADDGLLVLDRDGNGTIDSGRELFGDNTIKSNGERAQNGFDALADWDVNEDGVIDAQDEIFTELRLWRDLNQDGISQSEELLTLSDLNIASINLQNTKNNTNLNGTGNVQTLAANLFILF
jgi:hypothetical protein